MQFKVGSVLFSGELSARLLFETEKISKVRVSEEELSIKAQKDSLIFRGELELEDVILLREILKKWLEIVDISDRDIGNLELLLEEVVTNILRHSYGGRDRKYLEFSLNIEKESYLISTKDYGVNGRNKILIKRLCNHYKLNKKSKKRGGIGLFIIKKLAVDLEYIPGEGDGHNSFFIKVRKEGHGNNR